MRAHLAVVAAIVCLLHPTTTPAGTPTLPPLQFTIFCLNYAADCNSAPASPMRGSRFRQLAIVNAVANATIIPDDSSSDSWQIYPRRGNCADFAVSKRHALLAHGWPPAMLLLAEVELRASGEHHLVLIARDQSGTWVLDSLRGHLMTLDEMTLHYSVIRVQSASDPRRWETSLSG